MAEAQDQATATNTQRGATITNSYVERQAKAYAVFESEIETISLMNTLATTRFSFGAAFLSFAIGIWTNAAFVTDKIPPEGAILAKVVAPIFCVLAAAGFILGAWALWSRHQIWKTIVSQSSSISQPPPQ